MVMSKKNKTLSTVSMKQGLVVSALILLAGLFALPAFSQDKGYDALERTQDRIEDLDIKVYEIIEMYPNTTYSYVYKDGDVVDVVITGIPEEKDKEQLEVYLINLENLRKDIMNRHNRFGVYYATETLPKPKVGYEDFYDKLHASINYPKRAKELGLEGSIYVKFVVTPQGEVENVMAFEKIEDTYADHVVEEMKKEAVRAVKDTSGEWVPAKVAGVPVSEYRVLPVQFKLESPYYSPVF